jgi:hypothetical protein
MPNYVTKALKQFQHIAKKRQYSLYPCVPIHYGTKKQYATQESKAPLLDDKAKQFIQQVCGKFLFLGRAVKSTLLCPISAIASQSSKPTEDTIRQTLQLLNYLRRRTLLPGKRYGISSPQWCKLFKQARSTQQSRWTLLSLQQHNCTTKQWCSTQHCTHNHQPPKQNWQDFTSWCVRRCTSE